MLKVVSPDIIHKTEARGVRISPGELGAVEDLRLMMREVPEAYAAYLEATAASVPRSLPGSTGDDSEQRFSRSASMAPAVQLRRARRPGLRHRALRRHSRTPTEFGPIITAGLGGVEMEILASQTRKGAAVAIAPTGTIDGEQLPRALHAAPSATSGCPGACAARDRLVDDDGLVECFQAFIDLANHFSAINPDARFHIEELEVNPFSVSGGRIAPLDGVCSFGPAARPPLPRPLAQDRQPAPAPLGCRHRRLRAAA